MVKPKIPKRTILGEQQLWSCKYFDVMEYTVQGKGAERPYFAVRRRHFNTIHVIALTPKDEVVLVKQFRPPVGKYVIELPAGLCDNPEEEPSDAARRELMEETGFEADDFDLVFSGPVSPGLSNEIFNLFLATEARHTGRGGGVGNEAIEVFLRPRRKLLNYLLDQSLQGDALVDAKLPTALILAAKFMLVGNE